MAMRYKSALWGQLKEGYAKLLYTYEVQQKQLAYVQRRQSLVKTMQIVLTSVSTVGFLSIAITDQTTLSWVAGISSVLSLALSLYSREANLGEVYSGPKFLDSRLVRHRETPYNCAKGTGRGSGMTKKKFANRQGGSLLLGVLDDGSVEGVPEQSALPIERNLVNVTCNPKLWPC